MRKTAGLILLLGVLFCLGFGCGSSETGGSAQSGKEAKYFKTTVNGNVTIDPTEHHALKGDRIIWTIEGGTGKVVFDSPPFSFSISEQDSLSLVVSDSLNTPDTLAFTVEVDGRQGVAAVLIIE